MVRTPETPGGTRARRASDQKRSGKHSMQEPETVLHPTFLGQTIREMGQQRRGWGSAESRGDFQTDRYFSGRVRDILIYPPHACLK